MYNVYLINGNLPYFFAHVGIWNLYHIFWPHFVFLIGIRSLTIAETRSVAMQHAHAQRIA
jgi:hypothetical protein